MPFVQCAKRAHSRSRTTSPGLRGLFCEQHRLSRARRADAGVVELAVADYVRNSVGALQGGAVVALVDAAAESVASARMSSGAVHSGSTGALSRARPRRTDPYPHALARRIAGARRGCGSSCGHGPADRLVAVAVVRLAPLRLPGRSRPAFRGLGRAFVATEIGTVARALAPRALRVINRDVSVTPPLESMVPTFRGASTSRSSGALTVSQAEPLPFVETPDAPAPGTPARCPTPPRSRGAARHPAHARCC